MASEPKQQGVVVETIKTVVYALLIAGNDDALAGFRDEINDENLPDSLRVRTQEESSERAYSAADRAQRFLSLTAVISLLLSAVAIDARTKLERRFVSP